MTLSWFNGVLKRLDKEIPSHTTGEAAIADAIRKLPPDARPPVEAAVLGKIVAEHRTTRENLRELAASWLSGEKNGSVVIDRWKKADRSRRGK